MEDLEGRENHQVRERATSSTMTMQNLFPHKQVKSKTLTSVFITCWCPSHYVFGTDALEEREMGAGSEVGQKAILLLNFTDLNVHKHTEKYTNDDITLVLVHFATRRQSNAYLFPFYFLCEFNSHTLTSPFSHRVNDIYFRIHPLSLPPSPAVMR